MNHYLSMNGLEHAFLKEFGCSCPRCARPVHVANTSASLVSLADDGATAYHVLFDAGDGVCESLQRNPHLAGSRARLDWLLFTHWHSDHAIDVRRLGAAWMRSQRTRTPAPSRIRTWARGGSAGWLTREHAAAVATHLELHATQESHPAGVVLPPVPLDCADLTIVPVTTYHASADRSPADPSVRFPCCAGFVVQTARAKAALLWDLDATNEWIVQGGEAAQLIRGADCLFIDCNTWRQETHPLLHTSTSHASFFTVMRYAAALQPKLTLLVHLSGHEDSPGDGWGWDDAEWQANARREWHAHHVPGEVRVPQIGEQFAL